MMKALVLSDIHSNIYALDAIWKHEKNADRVLIAGDLVDYGPFPKEVIHWARTHDALCVRGNHDTHLINTYRSDAFDHLPPGDFKWVHDNCLKLDESDIAYLEALPEALGTEIDGYAYRMQHLYSGYDEIRSLKAFDALWNMPATPGVAGGAPRRMIFGHTHRRCTHYLADDVLWLNPGSASYRRPDDDSKLAHYAVITDGQVSLRAVTYDRAPLLQVVKQYDAKNRMNQLELEDAYFFFGDTAQPGHR